MKHAKHILCSLLAMAVILTTCIMPVEAASIRLNKTKATITVGSTVKLSVKGTKASVKWSSSNKAVATVKNGLVTGKKAGKATVKATVKKKTYKCVVTVKEKPVSEENKPEETVSEENKPEEEFVWEPGTEVLTENFTKVSDVGTTLMYVFDQDITNKRCAVLIDNVDVTVNSTIFKQYKDKTKTDTRLFIKLSNALSEGEHTLIVHVEGFAEYKNTFSFKKRTDVKGIVLPCYSKKTGQEVVWVTKKYAYMNLIPDVIGKDADIKVVIDGKQVKFTGYDGAELKLAGDGFAILHISTKEFPFEAGKTYHVTISCPGYDTYDEDVFFAD